MGFQWKREEYSFPDGVFEQAQEEAEALIERIQSTKRKKHDDPLYFDDAQKFAWEIFDYHAVPSSFDIQCEVHGESMRREYAVTIALLKSVWPKRSFSDAEIQLFRRIYSDLTIFIEHLGVLDEMIDYSLGRTDRFQFEVEHCRYKPESQKVARSEAAGKPEAPKPRQNAVPVVLLQTDDEKEALYTEIEELRASLKAKEQTINQMNRMYREVSEKEICDRRIIIVGGHDNWVHFLREKFPSWTYIKPGIAGTVPESVILHADYLFFFTDVISHGTYGKFIRTARTHGIPFGYLHGTNIPVTVRQVYNEISG